MTSRRQVFFDGCSYEALDNMTATAHDKARRRAHNGNGARAPYKMTRARGRRNHAPSSLGRLREYMLSCSRYMVRYAVLSLPVGMTRPPRVLSYER